MLHKATANRKMCQCVVRFLCQNNIKTFKGAIYDVNERTTVLLIHIASLPYLIVYVLSRNTAFSIDGAAWNNSISTTDTHS